MTRRLLITSALPYVNGDIHLGHLVEHIQTDTWARFQRLRGNQVLTICGADTHGTATMIAARKAGTTESAIIERQVQRHVDDFAAFGVVYDRYGSTDTPANRELVNEVWAALNRDGLVATRDVTQLYDPTAGTFLADRFVKGTCPKCGALDQYGDSCEKCGATYAPTDLKDARSTLSGAVPELRSSPHWFVRLEPKRAFLDAWTVEGGALDGAVSRWVKGAFLKDGEALRDWDVSRPAPYFGFEIPGAAGHYFYVWLDAPVGYVAATKEWCDANGDDWKRWWVDAGAEIHHNIGKDITYFHALFWPAMLHAAKWRLPDHLHIHGWLTVNGEKMSKSKGTFVLARTWSEIGLDAGALRYYLSSKLSGTVDDLDLNLTEFANKVNADLVGKVVNLASRTARFVPTLPATYPDDGGLFAHAAAEGAAIAAAYEAMDTAQATRRIMTLADRANEFVEKIAPWSLKKDPAKAVELANACAISLNLFRQLAVYLAPILPALAEDAGRLLNAPITSWDDAQRPLVGNAIAEFRSLMSRIDPAKLAELVERSKPTETVAEAAPAAPAYQAEPVAAQIAIEDFAKVDLRVARITAAEEVPKAKKILKLTVDLGSLGTRTIFAGIRTAYGEPAKLVGRSIIVVANLAPRTMSFGTSEGMAVAAGPGGSDIFLLSPDSGAQPGMRVG